MDNEAKKIAARNHALMCGDTAADEADAHHKLTALDLSVQHATEILLAGRNAKKTVMKLIERHMPADVSDMTRNAAITEVMNKKNLSYQDAEREVDFDQARRGVSDVALFTGRK